MYGAVVIAVVVAGGQTAGWGAAAAAVVVVGKTAVLVVGVVDHTDFEQQEQAEAELAPLGKRMAALIPQRPGADEEYRVGRRGVVVALAVAETAPVVHVAVAVAAVAIGSIVGQHNRSLRTKQIAPVEGAAVRAQALGPGPGQMATVGCTLAALEADLLLLLKRLPNMPNNLVGCFEEVAVDPGGG